MVPVRVITLTADGRDELYVRCAVSAHDGNAGFDWLRWPVWPFDDVSPWDPLSFRFTDGYRLRVLREGLAIRTGQTESLLDDFNKLFV